MAMRSGRAVHISMRKLARAAPEALEETGRGGAGGLGDEVRETCFATFAEI